MSDEKRLLQFYSQLGYKPLNRTWAKLELLLGLGTAGIGLLLGIWAVTKPTAELPWHLAIGGWLLFVLGSYLALAGHRSHLYQSNNELTAYLVEEIGQLKDKG